MRVDLKRLRPGLIEKLLPLKRRAVPLLSNRTRRSADTRELETFHGAMTLSPRRRGHALRAIRRFSGCVTSNTVAIHAKWNAMTSGARGLN